MAEIKLRNIQLLYEGETLTISSVRDPACSVDLDPRTVEDLVEFVHALTTHSNPGAADDDEKNRREAFRVPVVKDEDLQAWIVDGSKPLAVTPTNISMTGVFVELPKNLKKQFKIDDRLQVQMQCDKLKVLMGAIVKRVESRGIGLFFPATVKDDNIDPPQEMRKIVMELQRRWMTYLKKS